MLFNEIKTKDIAERVVDDTSDAVIATMGPDGRYSVINNGGNPKATKDGVTVANSIQYANPEEDLVHRILVEAALKTDAECGDGTTTTIFLTRNFYKKFRNKMNFVNKKKLEGFVKEAIRQIEIDSETVTPSDILLRELANTTSNGDEQIVENVIGIFNDHPGAEIRCMEGRSEEDVIDITDGLTLLAYYANPVFSPRGTNEPSTVQDFIPIVVDNNLKRMNGGQAEELLMMIMEINESNPDSQIVLFGRNFDNEFSQDIIRINNKLQMMKVICCTVTAAGSSGTGVMGDVAKVFDANVYSELLDYRGSVPKPYKEKIVISSGAVKVIDPSETTMARIKERVGYIQEEIGMLPPDRLNSSYGNILRSRINRLIGGEVTIYVGGVTSSDIKERIDRYVDVTKAVKSALQFGVIPGCGYMLVSAVEQMAEDPDYSNDPLFGEFKDVMVSQYEYLFKTRYTGMDKMKFIDLATGKTSHYPGDLGVYDTTKALVTALSGGMKTAIILASLSSVVLGNRYGSVRISL